MSQRRVVLEEGTSRLGLRQLAEKWWFTSGPRQVVIDGLGQDFGRAVATGVDERLFGFLARLAGEPIDTTAGTARDEILRRAALMAKASNSRVLVLVENRAWVDLAMWNLGPMWTNRVSEDKRGYVGSLVENGTTRLSMFARYLERYPKHILLILEESIGKVVDVLYEPGASIDGGRVEGELFVRVLDLNKNSGARERILQAIGPEAQGYPSDAEGREALLRRRVLLEVAANVDYQASGREVVQVLRLQSSVD